MEDYQKWVDQLTKQDYSDLLPKIQSEGKLLHAVMGINGEGGELTDAFKKHLIYNKPLDVDNIVEELGDIIFYVTMAANALNISLEEILGRNRQKLNKRYKLGFYSNEQAIKRADKTDKE